MGKDEEMIKRVAAALRALGVDVKELEPCEIYFNYLNYKLSYIERTVYEIREKIIFIEKLKYLNRKEMHK
ncbi:hypothetical protein B7L68_06880 [Thermoproteus sp. CP80]|jgi:hypothetical protein|nr:hypothetical protein B7L68_06880 [Thermoproteus sp. CP80]